MSERRNLARHASLAVRRVASEAKIPLSDQTCHDLARVVIDAMPVQEWFVGVVHDFQEEKAAAGLHEQGFGVYVPIMYTRRQEGRKIEARPALRFPGYILIRFDPRLDMHGPISGTPGMDDSSGSALLGGETPTMLPAGVVETLRTVERDDFFCARARTKRPPRKDLSPGDYVQVHRPNDAARHGLKGYFVGSDRGIAEVFVGLRCVKVAEVDLKRIDQPERKAA